MQVTKKEQGKGAARAKDAIFRARQGLLAPGVLKQQKEREGKGQRERGGRQQRTGRIALPRCSAASPACPAAQTARRPAAQAMDGRMGMRFIGCLLSPDTNIIALYRPACKSARRGLGASFAPGEFSGFDYPILFPFSSYLCHIRTL